MSNSMLSNWVFSATCLLGFATHGIAFGQSVYTGGFSGGGFPGYGLSGGYGLGYGSSYGGYGGYGGYGLGYGYGSGAGYGIGSSYYGSPGYAYGYGNYGYGGYGGYGPYYGGYGLGYGGGYGYGSGLGTGYGYGYFPYYYAPPTYLSYTNPSYASPLYTASAAKISTPLTLPPMSSTIHDGGEIVLFSPHGTTSDAQYALNGTSYTMKPGSLQRFRNDRTWIFEMNAENGPQKYTLAAGNYKFKSSVDGMGLFTTKDRPEDAVPVAPRATPIPNMSSTPVPPSPIPTP